MNPTASLVLVLLALKMAAAAPADLRPSELTAPQPAVEVNEAEGSDRDARAVEHIAETKFGIKNFILDLIFGKINQAIDAKTRFVAQLDRLNIEKNKNLLSPDCEKGATGSAGFSGYPAASSSASGGASAGAGQGQYSLSLGQAQSGVALAQGYPKQIPWASPSLGEAPPYQSFSTW